MNPRSFISGTGRFLQGARLAVLAASVLGVICLQDPASSDVLAPKALWFAVALGLLPALSALRLWWDAPLRFPPRPILFALAAACAALSVAYLASPLRVQAQDSWQNCLFAALLFAAAVDLFSTEDARRWFLRCLILGSAWAGGRSLAQRMGFDGSALAAQLSDSFGHRIAGCFGNPNFAGGFFVLVLPLLVHQGLAGEDRAWRFLARAAAVLALLGLDLSAGKAALLGAFAAAALAGHLLFWSDALPALKRRALVRLGSALALALAVGVLSLPADSLHRIAGGPAAWGESVAFRRVTWAGTWDMVEARPWTGWGPGTFSAAYPPFRRPEAMAVQQQHSYEVTAPENWPLHILAETGFLGLATVLVFLFLALRPLWRSAKGWAGDPKTAGMALAVLCAVAACLACNLASLDLFLPSTFLPLVLMLALGTALTCRNAPSITLNPENFARALVSVSLAFMASVPVVQALLHTQAARLLAQGRALSQAARFAEAVPVYQLALQFDPGLLEARYFLGNSLLDAGGDSAAAKAADAYAGLRLYAPDYVQVHAKLGRLRQAQGLTAEAAQEYEYQLKLDPWDLDTVQALASLYAGDGHLAEAQAVLDDASKRWPENGDIARNLAAVEMAFLAKKGRP